MFRKNRKSSKRFNKKASNRQLSNKIQLKICPSYNKSLSMFQKINLSVNHNINNKDKSNKIKQSGRTFQKHSRSNK